MSNEPELVWIGDIDGLMQAQLARSFLEDAGFTVHMQGEAVAGVYGLFSGPLGTVRLFVPADQADEARSLLEEFE